MTSTSFNTGYSLQRNSSKVIQPPGGQTADIFGRSTYAEQGYSSASSQAGSDVASSRVHIETDQQQQQQQTPMDGMLAAKQQQMQQQQQSNVASNTNGQMSPTGSVGSSVASTGLTGSSVSGGGQQLLMADDFKPQQDSMRPMSSASSTAGSLLDASRTPKKTIPVLRRNPITGEIIENPVERPTVVRVRQPPGGRSSGIF